MPHIDIVVKNKIAAVNNDEYICGNSDYVLNFIFDSEWDALTSKTARIQYGGKYTDVVFTGTQCPMPVLKNVLLFTVGVYAGNLHTTTPATVKARKSILCDKGLPANPSPSVYSQIMNMLNTTGTVVTSASISNALGYTPADEDDIPTKVSELQNDRGYLTEHQDISGKADVNHTHSYSDLTGTPVVSGAYDDTQINNRVSALETGKADANHTHDYDTLTNKPSIPSAYNDTELRGRVESLETGKANATHTHTLSQITDYVATSQGAIQGTGLSELQKSLIISIMRNGLYKEDISSSITQLADSFGITTDEPSVLPDDDDEQSQVVWSTLSFSNTNMIPNSDTGILESGTYATTDMLLIPQGAKWLERVTTRTNDYGFYFYDEDQNYMKFSTQKTVLIENETGLCIFVADGAKYVRIAQRNGSTISSVTWTIPRELKLTTSNPEGLYYVPVSLGRWLYPSGTWNTSLTVFYANSTALSCSGVSRINTIASLETTEFVFMDNNGQILSQVTATSSGAYISNDSVRYADVPDGATKFYFNSRLASNIHRPIILKMEGASDA